MVSNTLSYMVRCTIGPQEFCSYIRPNVQEDLKPLHASVLLLVSAWHGQLWNGGDSCRCVMQGSGAGKECILGQCGRAQAVPRLPIMRADQPQEG